MQSQMMVPHDHEIKQDFTHPGSGLGHDDDDDDDDAGLHQTYEVFATCS